MLYKPSANAISIGDNLHVDYRFPNTGTTYGTGQDFTADAAGTSFSHAFGALTFDISVTADTISISRFQWEDEPNGRLEGFSSSPSITFNGLVFTDLSEAFSSFSITSVTALPGFDASRVALNANDLSLNFMGLNYTVGESKIVLQAQTTTNVPEGGNTLTMLGASALALVVLGYRIRTA